MITNHANKILSLSSQQQNMLYKNYEHKKHCKLKTMNDNKSDPKHTK